MSENGDLAALRSENGDLAALRRTENEDLAALRKMDKLYGDLAAVRKITRLSSCCCVLAMDQRICVGPWLQLNGANIAAIVRGFLPEQYLRSFG